MKLRPYQEQAVESVWQYLRGHDDNPVIVLPTGCGKAVIIAELCRQAVLNWGGRVLILTHVRELVAQGAEKLRLFLPPNMVGVHSAGLNRRDLNQPVICGGIQSLYRRACDLGAFNLILVDECHLLPPDGLGMYRRFLQDARVVNPAVRLCGLTATPFRLSSGPLCSPDGLLNAVCYEAGIKEMIEAGWLSPLVSKVGRRNADVSGLSVRGGEFAASEAEDLMDADALVRSAVAEVVEATRDRRACLLFCAGVRHAEHVARVFMEDHGLECGFVEGNTPSGERARTIARFKGEVAAGSLFDPAAQPLRYLANVGILGTGFDHPATDCIALLRPTMSPGLLIQQVGRGFRIAPGKRDCLVLDFAGNLIRHGPVDLLKAGDRPRAKGDAESPARECPSCHRVCHASVAVCPECGYEFPRNDKPKHEAHASEAPVVSSDAPDEPREFEVLETAYAVHHKKNAPPGHPPSLRVSYRVGCYADWFSEWVCPAHRGYARDKFVQWWSRRSHYPAPRTVDDALRMAQEGCLAKTLGIRVAADANGYDKIVAWSLGDLPDVDSGLMEAIRETPAGEPWPVGVPAGGGGALDDDFEDIPF